MATKVHFLGIGGSGASGAAAIAEAQGFEITGCDLEPHNEFTTIFKHDQLLTGHSPDHLYCHPERSEGSLANASSLNKLRDSSLITQNDREKKNDKLIDILAVTPAIFSLDPDNPELVEAKKRNIPVITWQQFVGEYLTKDKFVIAVCGTHGKTTTTAMIAELLEDTGLNPTVLLGAIVPKWGTNYRIPRQKVHDREYFIIEADEFNDNFLPTKPDIAVVTNIEMDHPEYFKDFEAVKESFKKFLDSTKEKIVANLSNPGVKQTLNVHSKSVNIIIDYSKYLIKFPLQVPGQFNVINASAVFQVGLILKIDPPIIKKSLQNFQGVSRRFEYIGSYLGAKVYSDFGHHPTEIKATMEATREKFPDHRILLIYQPHMFSRTKALFNDFVKVFQKVPVDKIFIMDIYPSREVDTGLVSSQQLVQGIQKKLEPKFRNGGKVVPEVKYIGNKNQTLDKLKPEIKRGDIVFFMSAGDTDKLAKELVSGLK